MVPSGSHLAFSHEAMAGVDPNGGISARDRLGRCYELAAKYVMNNPTSALAHGSIGGPLAQANARGSPKIGHAWAIDADGEIFEPTTGRHFSRHDFRHLFDGVDWIVYTQDEVFRHVTRSGHWGPWDRDYIAFEEDLATKFERWKSIQAKTALYDEELDLGEPTERGSNASPSLRRGDWGYYDREQALRDAGMPGGQTFTDPAAVERYVRMVLADHGITDQSIVVRLSPERTGVSGVMPRNDGTGWLMVLSAGMTTEAFVLHETAHILNRLTRKGKVPSHAGAFAEIHARLLWKYLGVRLPVFGSKTAGAETAKTADLSGSRLWWRFHPAHREFLPEAATSTPIYNTFEEKPAPGFSAVSNPWHLFMYAGNMGWLHPKGPSKAWQDDIIAFTGQMRTAPADADQWGWRDYTGHDGEPLVIPDMRIVYRFTWDQFVRELIKTPFPPGYLWGRPGRGGDWGGGRGSWEELARSLAGSKGETWDDDHPGAEAIRHIITTWAPEMAKASHRSPVAPPSCRGVWRVRSAEGGSVPRESADRMEARLAAVKVPQTLYREGNASITVTAAPRLQRAFDWTLEQEYANNDPRIKVFAAGTAWPGEVVLADVEVPWGADLHQIVQRATREAKEGRSRLSVKFDNATYALVAWGQTGVNGGVIATSRSLDGMWGPPTKVGYNDPLDHFYRVLFGTADRQAVWTAWLRDVANVRPPDEPSHPSVGEATTITVYRGISLGPGDDPTSTTKSEREGTGSSWTTELSIAQAIAERGMAGFNLDNRPGQVQRVDASGYNTSSGRKVERRIPTVLRAEVTLGDNASLYEGMGGYRYLTNEREVDIPRGTEFTLTGWMQADEIPLDPADKRRAERLVERKRELQGSSGTSEQWREFYDSPEYVNGGESYEVTWRWGRWRDVSIKRRASGMSYTTTNQGPLRSSAGAARGFTCEVPQIGRAAVDMARRMANRTATVDDILACATWAMDGRVGNQWGLDSDAEFEGWGHGGAEDYAWIVDHEDTVKGWVESTVEGGWAASDEAIWEENQDNLGSLSVILIGETDAAYLNPLWDAAIAQGSTIRLTEVRYNAGWGWVTLPARGRSVTASAPLDLTLRVTRDPVAGGSVYTFTALAGDTEVGWLDFDVNHDGEVSVGLIEVRPSWRRKGVATFLARAMVAEFGPDIDWGNFTADGRKWKRTFVEGSYRAPRSGYPEGHEACRLATEKLERQGHDLGQWKASTSGMSREYESYFAECVECGERFRVEAWDSERTAKQYPRLVDVYRAEEVAPGYRLTAPTGAGTDDIWNDKPCSPRDVGDLHRGVRLTDLGVIEEVVRSLGRNPTQAGPAIVEHLAQRGLGNSWSMSWDVSAGYSKGRVLNLSFGPRARYEFDPKDWEGEWLPVVLTAKRIRGDQRRNWKPPRQPGAHPEYEHEAEVWCEGSIMRVHSVKVWWDGRWVETLGSEIRARASEDGTIFRGSMKSCSRTPSAMQHHGSQVTLWRGLHYGRVSEADAASVMARADAWVRGFIQSRVGIHWTDDPGSAWNFALDRDSEGWDRGGWDEDDDGDWTVGVVLEAAVPSSAVLDPDSDEHRDYAMSDAILPYGIEREVTVRSDSPVTVTRATLVAVDPDGMEHTRDINLNLRVTAAAGDRTGVPELDAVIEAFLDEPFMGTTTRIRDLTAAQAHGMCAEVALQFVEFAQGRGIEQVYAVDTDMDEMGYVTRGTPQGEVLDADGEIVMGWYDTHTVNEVYLSGQAWPYIIDFTARQYGYDTPVKISSVASRDGYGGGHSPSEDDPPLHDLLAVEHFPRDVYENLRHYTFGEWGRESIRVIQQVRGQPDAPVTIYRAVPPGVTEINTGDWVALERGYALNHAEGRITEEWGDEAESWVDVDPPQDWPVLSITVPARMIRNGGNDLIEWGYFGPPVRGLTPINKRASIPNRDGFWWRLHDPSDPFGPGMGRSKPIGRPYMVRPGYSCWPSPWDVAVYAVLYGWTTGKGRASQAEVLCFTGSQIGVGVDEEPLVDPDGKMVYRYSVEQFVALLESNPSADLSDAFAESIYAIPREAWFHEARYDWDPRVPALERLHELVGQKLGYDRPRRLGHQREASVGTQSHAEMVEWAANRWRSSFGEARLIREAAESGKGDEPYLSMARALLSEIEASPRQRYGVRVDHRTFREGETVDFPLTSLAKSSQDAAPYESLSDGFGLSDPRANWITLIDCPAYVYPDGREFITSGRFVVERIIPWTPPWEGKPGFDVTLNGQRTMTEMRYVGPSGARIARTASMEGTAYRGVPVALTEAQGIELLEAIIAGRTNVAHRLLVDAMATSVRERWYTTFDVPDDDAGRWWTNKRADAMEYSWSKGDGWMTVPVVMTARYSEEDWAHGMEMYPNGDVVWHLEPGTPVNITEFHAVLPDAAEARRLLDGWRGIASPGNFDAPREWWDGREVRLDIPPMRATATLGGPKEATSGVTHLGRSPLDYGNPCQRIAVIDPSAPPAKKGWAYFTTEESEDRLTGKPRQGSGTAVEGMVGFLDYQVLSDSIFIAYVATRPDYRTQGVAKRLLDWIYAEAKRQGKSRVEWGRVFYPAEILYWKYHDDPALNLGLGTHGKPESGSQFRQGSAQRVVRRLSDEHLDFYLAVEGSDPIAVLVANTDEDIISLIYTVPSRRRQGVASWLLDEARRVSGNRIEHSDSRSPAGEAWARGRGASPSGDRIDQRQSEWDGQDALDYAAKMVGLSRQGHKMASKPRVHIGVPSQDMLIVYQRSADTFGFYPMGRGKWMPTGTTDEFWRLPAIPGSDGWNGMDGTWITVRGGVLMPGSGHRNPTSHTAYHPFFVEALERLMDLDPSFGRWMLVDADDTYSAVGYRGTVVDFLRRVNDMRAEWATQNGVTASRHEAFAFIDLYHGTCRYYADKILRDGLKPRDTSGVANHWSGDAWASREGLVYLSHPSRLTISHSAMRNAADAVRKMMLDTIDREVREGAYDEVTAEEFRKSLNRYGPESHPALDAVLLRVRIPASHFGNFVHDEDTERHSLEVERASGYPSWMASLGSDAVVAYRGEIPPSWITVSASGRDAYRAGVTGDDRAWRRAAAANA